MSQAGSISGNGGGTSATDFVADSGMAQPSGGEIDLLGGTLINTSAAGNIVTFNADDEVVGSIVTDSGTCTPASNAFNLLGGAGIDTSAVGDTITITFDGSEDPEIPTSFPTDSGTATPALNALTLTGGTGIDTSGAGAVATFAVAATVPLSVGTDGTAATPAANAFTIAGGDGITTSASGATVTVTLDNPVTVALGGSGRATATEYAVICGGTTTTGAHQSIASVGTSGQVLTSNGAAALPTFQDAASGGLTAPLTGTYRVVSSADDLENTDYFVAVDTTGGAFTLGLLETSMSTPQFFAIKDIAGNCGTDNLTITPSAGNIDGSASFVLNADYGAINLVYDGTDFWIY